MCSMVTGLPPHRHAATRNGLRMQPGLDSLPKSLPGTVEHGSVRRDLDPQGPLDSLGEHFQTYGERLESRRWFGILNSEATCEDVTEMPSNGWGTQSRPRLVNPFSSGFIRSSRMHPIGFTRNLPRGSGSMTINSRGATDMTPRLRPWTNRLPNCSPSPQEGGFGNLLVVITADHGESLGEHDYWGHGRYLYEPSLRIPLGIAWEGKIAPRTVDPGDTARPRTDPPRSRRRRHAGGAAG